MPAPTPSPPRALRERQARVSQLGLREKSEEGYETGFLSGSAPRVVCPGQLCLLTNFREVPSLTSLTAKRAKTLCIWLISLAPIHCLRKRVLMVASRQRHLCELKGTYGVAESCLPFRNGLQSFGRCTSFIHQPMAGEAYVFHAGLSFFFLPNYHFPFFFPSLGSFFLCSPLASLPNSMLATSQLTGMLSKTYCSPSIGGLIFLSHKVDRLNQRGLVYSDRWEPLWPPLK